MYIYVFDMIHRNLKSVHHPLSRSFRDSTQEICSPIVYRLRSFWPIASVNLTQLWITMSPLVPWFSMILLYYRWLVVLTILKNISQLGLLFPIYEKIKNVPNHQPNSVQCVSGAMWNYPSGYPRRGTCRLPSPRQARRGPEAGMGWFQIQWL